MRALHHHLHLRRAGRPRQRVQDLLSQAAALRLHAAYRRRRGGVPYVPRRRPAAPDLPHVRRGLCAPRHPPPDQSGLPGRDGVGHRLGRVPAPVHHRSRRSPAGAHFGGAHLRPGCGQDCLAVQALVQCLHGAVHDQDRLLRLQDRLHRRHQGQAHRRGGAHAGHHVLHLQAPPQQPPCPAAALPPHVHAGEAQHAPGAARQGEPAGHHVGRGEG